MRLVDRDREGPLAYRPQSQAQRLVHVAARQWSVDGEQDLCGDLHA